jgi:glycine oxidase
MVGDLDRRRVAVVGGGVVGCATAYELIRAGFEVTLIERDTIGAHASKINAGNLNPLFGTPPELVPLALGAFRIHAEVRDELARLGFADSPALPLRRIHLGRDEEDRREMERTASVHNATEGFSATWLDRDGLSRIEPRLARDIGFGLVTTGALFIDSYLFTKSLAEAAKKLGATLVQAAVTGVSRRGGRVTAIRIGRDLLACDEVVLATGPWVAESESWLGIELPVIPVKGELLRVRMKEPLSSDFTWKSAALYRRRHGEVWIGGTMENCGFDSTPTFETKELLMEGATRMIPEMQSATILDHVAALRPVSMQNTPIAGRAAGWQNVYVANGGGTKGVLLCVGMARSIRNLLVEGSKNVVRQDPVR